MTFLGSSPPQDLFHVYLLRAMLPPWMIKPGYTSQWPGRSPLEIPQVVPIFPFGAHDVESFDEAFCP